MIDRGFKRKIEKQGNAWAIHKNTQEEDRQLIPLAIVGRRKSRN